MCYDFLLDVLNTFNVKGYAIPTPKVESNPGAGYLRNYIGVILHIEALCDTGQIIINIQ